MGKLILLVYLVTSNMMSSAGHTHMKMTPCSLLWHQCECKTIHQQSKAPPDNT